MPRTLANNRRERLSALMILSEAKVWGDYRGELRKGLGNHQRGEQGGRLRLIQAQRDVF